MVPGKPNSAHRIFQGRNCRLCKTARGIIISGSVALDWIHPWQVSSTFEWIQSGKGEWRATINPGFVNGRDAFISMPAGWPTPRDDARDVPLTDDPTPCLDLGDWRNPQISSGIGITDDGDITYGPGEGFPDFFIALGVQAAAPGGESADPPYDPTRTRQIRATDIVLTQPRIGAHLDVATGDQVADGQSESVSRVFDNSYFATTGGRARLTAVSQYTPPNSDDSSDDLKAVFGTLLDGSDPQYDQILIATVWAVSQPDAGEDAMPDATWDAYAQHFVFWNLNYAAGSFAPPVVDDPIQLIVPLAGGVAQPIIDSLLGAVNDADSEIAAYLSQADARGKFWSI
jgi:hypothetical protein